MSSGFRVKSSVLGHDRNRIPGDVEGDSQSGPVRPRTIVSTLFLRRPPVVNSQAVGRRVPQPGGRCVGGLHVGVSAASVDVVPYLPAAAALPLIYSGRCLHNRAKSDERQTATTGDGHGDTAGEDHQLQGAAEAEASTGSSRRTSKGNGPYEAYASPRSTSFVRSMDSRRGSSTSNLTVAEERLNLGGSAARRPDGAEANERWDSRRVPGVAERSVTACVRRRVECDRAAAPAQWTSRLGEEDHDPSSGAQRCVCFRLVVGILGDRISNAIAHSLRSRYPLSQKRQPVPRWWLSWVGRSKSPDSESCSPTKRARRGSRARAGTSVSSEPGVCGSPDKTLATRRKQESFLPPVVSIPHASLVVGS